MALPCLDAIVDSSLALPGLFEQAYLTALSSHMEVGGHLSEDANLTFKFQQRLFIWYCLEVAIAAENAGGIDHSIIKR
jgi:hypothetical protein